MALQIERILESRFEFSLDGGNPISDNAPNLTTFGNICHFKTKNGANIIADQNITFADVTVIDTFGGSGTFSSFPNVQALWVKLIELQFFDGLASGGGGGGATRFDALTDAFTYFGNDGKVPVVNESQLELVPTTFYNFNQFIQLDDVSINSLIDGKILGVSLVSGVPKIVLTDSPIDTEQLVSAVGGFYYADLTTQTTPIAYTTGDTQLTNDIEGALTLLNHPPYGVTGVWDETTNTFDFSELSLGDSVFLRVELNVTTSAANQNSSFKIYLGEGTADARYIAFDNIFSKTAGVNSFVSELHFQINKENWRTTAAKLLFTSDASADIEVVGWHVYIVRKSVNIFDFSDNDFKTFTVAQLASPTVDVTTNNGTVKIGYEGVGNKLTNILFDVIFSKYLVNINALLGSKSIELGVYNKTKKTFLSAPITSFTEPSTGYFNAVLGEVIDLSDVDLGDELTFDFSISPLGGGSTSTKQSFTATPSQTEFVLSTTPSNIDVWVDGQYQIETIDYTLSTNTVTLTNGAFSGSIITIRKY